jgi:hypothetical protein
MSTPESKVKAKIKRVLAQYDVWVNMPVSMGYGQHGIPDFICCGMSVGGRAGLFFSIEAKANGGKPTALQDMQMQRIRKAGGVTFVIDEHNIEELEAWLRLYIKTVN